MDEILIILYYIFNLLCIIALPFIFGASIGFIWNGVYHLIKVIFLFISRIKILKINTIIETTTFAVLAVIYIILGLLIGYLGYIYIVAPWIQWFAYADASGK